MRHQAAIVSFCGVTRSLFANDSGRLFVWNPPNLGNLLAYERNRFKDLS